ncbi:hypothetical protein [Methylobacterium fujisawaense]|uniref:hypothetical protein n=1 Tax=Methylobacterium fujisawaense TaxID=107400 RepID=UPI00313DD21A
MTLSVHVFVPELLDRTAEVTTVAREAGGRIRDVWHDTVKPGENRCFSAHEDVSIFVAEGRGGQQDGHAALLGVFAFALGEPVSLVGSDECGTVIARAEYRESCRNYLVRYRAADGRLTEAWWSEAAITAPSTPDASPDPAADAGTEAPALQA